MCRDTSDSPPSLPTVKQPQITIITETDGAQQSTVQALSPSSPSGHRRSLSDSSSSLPIPESSMESKKSSSLQDMNQDSPCIDVSGVCVCVRACMRVCVRIMCYVVYCNEVWDLIIIPNVYADTLIVVSCSK